MIQYLKHFKSPLKDLLQIKQAWQRNIKFHFYSYINTKFSHQNAVQAALFKTFTSFKIVQVFQ